MGSAKLRSDIGVPPRRHVQSGAEAPYSKDTTRSRQIGSIVLTLQSDRNQRQMRFAYVVRKPSMST